MPKLNLQEVLNDDDVIKAMNPKEWEFRCGTCDNFCDIFGRYSEFKTIEKCPFEGKVTWDTDYRKIGCKCYWN